MTITDSDLAQWNALCDKATPGEWVVGPKTKTTILSDDGCVADSFWLIDSQKPKAERDAAFIAASRTAVPRLISELESLRAAIDDIREVINDPELRDKFKAEYTAEKIRSLHTGGKGEG